VKLASFVAAGRERLGALLEDDSLVDLAEIAQTAGVKAHDLAKLSDMNLLIEAGAQGLEMARRALEYAHTQPKKARYKIGDVRWRAPVRRPSKIVCLALNNNANSERILSGPKHPAAFIKSANALIGHGEAIELKPAYGRCHPEPELAIVIGKAAKEIAAKQAYDYVFGYTIHNDVTSPTMRDEDTFHYGAIHPAKDDPRKIEYVDTWVSYTGRYKNSDTFSPMGPCLVTRDEIADPHALAVTCSHKGEVVAEDTTANLFYKTPEVLSFLSQYMTLLPGDIVSLGTAVKRSTPDSRAVQNVDLNKLGGPVTVSIQGIGVLSNPVSARTNRK